jgi:hypothetical protein
MGNRPQREWILLEKRRWPRFLGISPTNRDQFIQNLNLYLSGI